MTVPSGAIMAHPKRHGWAVNLSRETGLPIVWDQINTVWDTAKRAWRHAAEGGTTHSVVLQDDAIPCRDLLATLQVLSDLYPDEPFCLTVIDYRLHGARREYMQAVESGKPFWSSNAAVSAVGLMLPTKDIEPMITFGESFATIHDDLKVRNYYRSLGRKMRFPIPSLVQHRNVDVNPSLVPGNDGRWSDRESSTFLGEHVSGLTVNWAGNRPSQARSHMQFRNMRTGEEISVPFGSKAAKHLSRRANWQQVGAPDPVPVMAEYDPVGDPPARQGPGSSRGAWAAYAHLLGLPTEGLSRAEIIEACDAR